MLTEEAKKLARSYMDRLVGSELDVIIEKSGDNYSLGLSARYVRARVEGVFERRTRLCGTAVGCDDGLVFCQAE